MLMIRLEESEYGSAWVLGDKSGLPDADGDIKGINHCYSVAIRHNTFIYMHKIEVVMQSVRLIPV